jgi:hypothetical protein
MVNEIGAAIESLPLSRLFACYYLYFIGLEVTNRHFFQNFYWIDKLLNIIWLWLFGVSDLIAGGLTGNSDRMAGQKTGEIR